MIDSFPNAELISRDFFITRRGRASTTQRASKLIRRDFFITRRGRVSSKEDAYPLEYNAPVTFPR